jgi:hypothetical protein
VADVVGVGVGDRVGVGERVGVGDKVGVGDMVGVVTGCVVADGERLGTGSGVDSPPAVGSLVQPAAANSNTTARTR